MSVPVTLVFPPAADPSLPYGALPLLGAVLRRAGYDDVELRDVNLEVFDDLLRADLLASAAERLPGAAAATGLTAENAADVVANIDAARRILRDPVDFYSPPKLLFAKRIFHLAGNLVTASHPDLRFGKYSYSPATYDSYAEVARAVETDPGPLAGYYRDVAVPSLLARGPRVLGLSVPYFSQLIPAFLLAEAIRAQDPGVHITFGGPVVTWGKEVLMADARFGRWLDSFFVGEADETLLHFVEALDGRRDIASVRNIVRYTPDGVANQLDPAYQLNLDWLPTPDYTMMPLEKYFAPKRIICMVPTRGCYYNKCAFCNYAFIKMAPYRMRSPHLIAEDVATVTTATGEDVFSFESDVILPRHLRTISEALLERQVDIKWHGVARFEKGFSPEVFDTMHKAGCIRIYMGMESANERVLKAMDKGTDPRRMADILAMCHAAGISVEAGVFSDFPSETPEEAEDTYRFLRDHRHVIGRADAGTFRLLKGAPIADQPELYQIKVRDDPAKKWYHLDYTDVTRRANGGAGSLIERIQQMYPEVALVDVPEDILYTAKFGPNVFRRFFDSAAHVARPPVPADAVLTLAPNVELQQVRVANSGAVHFHDTAEEPTARFEISRLSITIAVDRGRAGVYPLTESEERMLRLVSRAPVTAADARFEAGDETGLVELLAERGLLTVEFRQDAAVPQRARS